MKIENITIHNFRSIREQSFSLQNYSLLIGPNNAGKTNIMDALRIFYENDLKYSQSRDFPKFPDITDNESWIEIEYLLDDDDYNDLKDEYKLPNNSLKVRKYLQSDTDRVKSNQSNIYAYEQNGLSNNLFYGAKNISEAKLGNVIYIPELSKIDEYTKLTGPSPFRNLLEFVVKKVVKNSPAFDQLNKSFENFNTTFLAESSKDGISLNSLITDINTHVAGWNISFGIDINPIKMDGLIKNLISHYLEDNNMKGQKMDVSSFGQGLQRHLIYTLISLSAKYKDTSAKKTKKEFSPDYNLILFEEPEAFLHPTQQEIMNISLKNLSKEKSQQALITSHSVHFVSKNIDEVNSILKLAKSTAETRIHQINETALADILNENKVLKTILGEVATDKDLELESIRYCLWFDPDRCSAFFSDFVLICEGMSEKSLIDTLIKAGEINLNNSKTYILNAGGKHDIHRYMNIFGRLGIQHSVLHDGDNNRERHEKINNFIEQNRNSYTMNLHSFPDDLERFLEIEVVNHPYKKPLNVMWHYRNGKIKKERLNELNKIIKKLIDDEDNVL